MTDILIKTGEEILKTLQHGIELPKRLNQKWASLSLLREKIKDCKDEILEFHLEDDKHIFSDLTEYMSYRAGQINAIIDKHFSELLEENEQSRKKKKSKKLQPWHGRNAEDSFRQEMENRKALARISVELQDNQK